MTATIDGTTGYVVERYVYDAYGKATACEDDWTPTGAPTADGPLYCGYFFDAQTGLDLARNRYYHSTLSTWINRDPIESSPNLYQYCDDNPVIYVDPWGLYYDIWLPNHPTISSTPTQAKLDEAALMRKAAQSIIDKQDSPETVCDLWGMQQGGQGYPKWKWEGGILSGLLLDGHQEGVEHFGTVELVVGQQTTQVTRHTQVTIEVRDPETGQSRKVVVSANRTLNVAGQLALLDDFDLIYDEYQCVACVMGNTVRSGWHKHYLSVRETQHWAWKTMTVLGDSGVT